MLRYIGTDLQYYEGSSEGKTVFYDLSSVLMLVLVYRGMAWFMAPFPHVKFPVLDGDHLKTALFYDTFTTWVHIFRLWPGV
jgi:hypothetical protein